MINNLTMSKLVAVKGDMVIGSFAVFSLVLGSVVTFTLTSFFSTILNSGVRFDNGPFDVIFYQKK